MIRLERINVNNYKQCLRLSVAKHQKGFVCSNVESLAKAYVCYDYIYPFVIFDDDVMIGFVMLRYHEENQSYFLWEFMIDERYQGKGYGKESLLKVIAWVKEENLVMSLVTTYKIGNEVAKCLYEGVGFKYLSTCEEEQEVNLILTLK